MKKKELLELIKDSNRRNGRLERTIETLKIRLSRLENPHKYKKGDKVMIAKTESTVGATGNKYIVAECTHNTTYHNAYYNSSCNSYVLTNGIDVLSNINENRLSPYKR